MSGFVLQSIGVTADPGFVLESIEASSSIAVLHDLDAGNINPTLTVISGAETATPSIELTPRITPSSAGGGHVHWLFALSGAAGKQPTITVSNAARRNQTTMGESWRPVYSYDLVTWYQATAFTPLSSPTRVQFQFPTAFAADTVYIADHPVFQAAKFDALAAEMAADPTGLVHLSSVATSGGVIGTTPAENDDIGRSVGGNAMYGFRLEDESTTTTDGKPRRELVVTCGIHAGEVIDGWYLRSLVDYYINDMSATGVAFRRNWRVLAYFALTPNGRKGGNWRGNWRSTEDPNRDWSAPGAFSLFENTTVRDAILADATRRDVLLDFHSDSAALVVPKIYYRSDLPFERYTAFKSAFDARDTSALTLALSSAAQTIGEWFATNGAKLVITSEPGTRTSATVERYGQIATNYVGALADMDAAGWFDEAPAGTGVSSDAVASYVIRASVSADATADNAIRAEVTTDATAAYTLRASVSADAVAAYTIAAALSSVSADAVAIYTVRAAVQSDVAAAYAIRSSISADAAAAYLVRGTAQQDAAASYTVRGQVSADAAAAYAIENAGQVSANAEASYAIRGLVSATAVDTYAIRTPASADATASYTIRSAVQQDAAAAYTVRCTASADATAAYSILGLQSVSADAVAQYIVVGRVSADAVANYSVGTDGLPSSVTITVPSGRTITLRPR